MLSVLCRKVFWTRRVTMLSVLCVLLVATTLGSFRYAANVYYTSRAERWGLSVYWGRLVVFRSMIAVPSRQQWVWEWHGLARMENDNLKALSDVDVLMFGWGGKRGAGALRYDIWYLSAPLWIAGLAAGVVLGLTLGRRIGQLNRGCCATCGYDMQGASTDTCPECGTRA